jgi:three-Cys-motif partner protein
MSDEGITIASDGYLAIEFGPWAEDKLSHLDEYCATFNKATHKKWEKRIYIDLFSGPGKCVRKGTKREFNGSPLLALNCDIPFTHYFFNDIKLEYIEALKKRTQSYNYSIDYVNQDCNLAVDEILNKIPEHSICFAYIDPYYLEIKFDTIKKLTMSRPVDLLIVFHIGMARRNFFQPNLEMKQFFPPNVDWKKFPYDVIKGDRISTRPVLDAYESGLIEIGYPKQNIKDDVLERTRKNLPLYYLIFASKHQLGAHLYSGVISRKDSIQKKLL